MPEKPSYAELEQRIKELEQAESMRKQAEEALRKREEELRQQEKLQGVIEMAGSICHELNQPIQTVSGYSELIMMRLEEGDPLYDSIRSIKEQIDRMRDITKKMMTITRYKTTDYLDEKIIDIDKATQ